MAVTLSQEAEDLNLKWHEGDPVSLAFTVKGVDWSGDYKAEIRAQKNLVSPVVKELAVTAVLQGVDTAFTLAMSAADSAAIVAGRPWYWDLQQVGGVTRLQGQVLIDAQVTA